MPICKRDGFDGSIAKNKDQTFHDNDEVFFCEVTKEIFRDYEDYFRHVMAINSTVWQCEATGRENLTYAEALSSEKRARKKMEMFKDSLRPPVMLVMEEAKQSSVKALHTIIFKFIRRRFFIGEEIQALTDAEGGRFLPYQIKEIVPVSKIPPANGVYEDTERLRYKVKRIGDGPSPAIITVPFDNLRRQRFEFTSDNLQMFIKNNITRVDGILRAKPESYKKYVTDRNITFGSIFIGKMPHFTPAKIKKPTNAVQNKKQASMNKFVTKNNTEEISPQERAKLEAAREEKQRTLKEEMERVRREKQERLLEAERERAEKKAKLMEKIEEECNALLTKTDDLERTDQRLLPKFTPIQTLVPTKYLGDSFMLREFMHSFASILSGLEALRGNMSFFELSRALTQREVAGPLSDVVRILLGTIFDLQKEEEEDYAIDYLLLRQELRKSEPLITMSQASRAHLYAKRHFSMKINELPMDAMTVSEILRLHLLSSGACVRDRVEKLRQTYRNGYTTSEDPGLALRMQHPHLLQVLKMYTLYQLPITDIMRVLRCLMAQILTYGTTINILEDRNEQIAKARTELRALIATENRRLANLQAQKRLLNSKYHQQFISPEVRADNEKKVKLTNEMNASIAELEAQGEREQRKHNQQIINLHSELFNFVVYLGMDRAYRKYYAFESMPGLFIEHAPECYDVCLNDPPTNLAPSAMLESSINLPKNKKDLRSYLLKKYTDEEKHANIKNNNNNNSKTNNNNNNKLVVAVGENKENLEQTSLNGLPNGIKINGAGTEAEENVQQQVDGELLADKLPTQYELYMCTGDRKNCIVHDERNADRQRWSYIYKQEDIDALIEALNPLGERESQLREQLSAFRQLLFQHVRKCPVDMLSVDDPKALRNFKNNMQMDTHRRYYKANMGFEADADINDVMHAALVDRILQFETAIFTGDLGHLKVKDMPKWRQDLVNKTYDPQVKLQWGPNEQKLATTGNGTDEKEEEDGDVAFEDDDEDMDDVKDKDGGRYATKPYFDPAQNLGQNLEIDSEDSADEGISLHDSTTLRTNVKHLASALLQVEQSIEKRFFKEPFGAPVKQMKDKELQERKLKEGINRLKQWEVSLMESTSYSQIFLHLNLLHDSIMWARSTAKSYCQVCRRGSDPEKMLLCDECNGGTHMFCMKPKMKVVPEGNWYCSRCIKLLGLENQNQEKASTRRRRQLEANIEQEDAVAAAADSGSEISAASTNKSIQRNGVAEKRRGRGLRSNEIENMLEEGENGDENENDEENEAESEEEGVGEDEQEEEEEAEDEDGNSDEDEDNKENESAENTVEEEAVDDDEDETEENDDDNICTVCSYDGGDLNCTRCKDVFHLECANLKRPPRYNFVCSKCKLKDEKKRKKQESTEEDDTDFTDSSSDPPSKRARQGRSSLRNSVPNGVHNEYAKNTTTSNRRSHRRTGDNLPLNSPALYELLEDVMKHEQAWPFLRPVMQSEVPDYYTIIKYPMDFAKVKSKLNMGEYQLNEEVMNDIQLIFNNCDHYNHKGNEVYEAGAALERYVIDRCKKHNFPFRPSDMNV